jgi:hypothetical protein
MVDPLAGHGGFAESTGGPVKMRQESHLTRGSLFDLCHSIDCTKSTRLNTPGSCRNAAFDRKSITSLSPSHLA